MENELWQLDRSAAAALRPADFTVDRRLETRWRDNDSFGHVNNAVYYEYFDTAINTWLLLELSEPECVAAQRFVVESACRYLRPISFPAPLLLAHRVTSIGSSSVTYELGIFPLTGPGRSAGPIAALGRWVHVFVDAASQRPVHIPAVTRALLESAQAFP